MQVQEFFGTKETIFDTAIVQIAELGYEEANMREIAAQSGIKAASIYNHFRSKEEILGSIYAYYREHLFDTMPEMDELKRTVESGSRQQLMDAFFFTFEKAGQKQYLRMILITKIIYMRIFCDAKAKDIFVNLMIKTQEARTKAVLDYGISIGRFKNIDTWTYSRLLSSARHFLGIAAFTASDYVVGQLEEEQKLKAMLSGLLPD